MAFFTQSVEKLIAEFAKMPGIGEKTAQRLALYVLKQPRDEAMELAFSIRDVKKNITHCSRCYNLAEGELCPICSDAKRDASQICVVEYPRDLMAIEKGGEYRGLYHVLLGAVSPVDDVTPEDIKLKELVTRIEDEKTKEVIIFTNATTEGDLTAYYVAKNLEGLPVRVSRIARGVPAGSELEFLNEGVITDALRGRTDFTAEEPDG